MQVRAAAILIATLHSALASAQPSTSQVPAGFQAVTEVHGYKVEDPQPLATPISVDLATGAGAENCPAQAWTGAATFHNTDAGTIQYWGTGFWCMPIGFGTVQYPDGSTYFGMVNSFVASREAQFQRDQVRLAVRDGYGQAFQPATGQQWLGEFAAGAFKQDLAANQRFITAYTAATGSITDKAAPRVTPEIEALLEFTAEVAPATSKPKAGGGVRKLLFGAFAGRDGAKDAAPAPAIVPDGRLEVLPVALQGLEGISELDMVLRRFLKNWSSETKTATTQMGFFSEKCLAKDDQEAVLDSGDVRINDGRQVTQIWRSRRYFGEHKGCLPQGNGRIEYQNGDIWIGPVTYLKSQSASKGRVIPSFDTEHRFPVPDGLGYWHHAATGQAMVLSLRYGRPKGGVFFIAAWAGEIWNPRFVAVIHKDGRVAVYDDKNPLDWRGRNILTEGDVPGRLNWDRDGTLYLTNGANIRGRLSKNEVHEFWKPYTWQHPGLGVTLRGELAWVNGKPLIWSGPYFVEVTRQIGSLAPGHYLGDTQRFNLVDVPWNRPSRLFEQELVRIDAQQFATFVQRHEDSYQRRIADEKAKAKANLERTLAQERAEQQAWEREERAERARRDAEFRSAMAGAMSDLKQTVDRSVADLEASRQRSQDAINFANQLNAQRAEQERRNQEEQQRRDREARDATRAYEIAQAQSKANFANAMSAAERQQQMDAARLQQQTASMNRQTAQGGSYTSPFEQNARPVGSGTNSVSAVPSAQAPQQRAEPPNKSYPPVPQAVAVCLQRGGGKFTCYGALGSPSSVGPDQPSGWKTPEEWLGYVGNCTGAQRRSLTDGSVAWTCGFGVAGIVKDVAAMTGVQVQRGTYYCDAGESYCKRTTPTGQ
jgi:hypothetical protein